MCVANRKQSPAGTQEKRACIGDALRATSQEGKGRDFRVTTFVPLFVVGTVGPNVAKRTGRPSYDEESSLLVTDQSIGHL